MEGPANSSKRLIDTIDAVRWCTRHPVRSAARSVVLMSKGTPSSALVPVFSAADCESDQMYHCRLAELHACLFATDLDAVNQCFQCHSALWTYSDYKQSVRKKKVGDPNS